MINTVLFDMGGTLEDIEYNKNTTIAVTKSLIHHLHQSDACINCEENDFWNRLNAGVMRYKAWSEKNELEKKPEEIWNDYYLADFSFDRDKIALIAEDLAQIWEVTYYNRTLRPDVKQALDRLKHQGYKLGIISNTASLYSVFNLLERYQIRDYFDDVTLSSVTGYRKPHRSIFQIALRQMQSLPKECVYVGDTLSRDVIGAKRLSFGAAVQIQSSLTTEKDMQVGASIRPDYTVKNISEILNFLDCIKNN
ncbi:MAG: HAD family hydrolase [Lachnospiraceae bacterium]